MIRHLSAATALCSLTLVSAPALAQTASPETTLVPGASIVLAQHGADSYGGWRGRRDWRDDDQGSNRDRSDDRDMSSGWQQSGPDRGDRRGGQQQQMQDQHQQMQEMRAHRQSMMSQRGHGLHIRMRRGDAAIDLHCPPAADYTSCISAVGQLIDRLGPSHASTGSSGAPAPATPAPDTQSGH